MKRLLSFGVLMLSILALVLSGCAGPATSTSSASSPASDTTQESSGETSRPPRPVSGANDLMASVKAVSWPVEPEALPAGWTDATGRFAALLFQKSAANPGNFMISPASVYLALAMTLNGADSTTRDAMLAALAAQGLTVADVNRAARSWITGLNRASAGTTVSISNSIWFDQDFVPFQPFLQANGDYFNAAAQKLDFKDPKTLDVINGWVSEATNGRIEQIIDQIRPDSVMFLINAIYFLADWGVPFEKADTRPQAFQAPDGEVEVDFMHRTGTMNFYQLDRATGIGLPYKDGRFAFFAILPDEGLDARTWLAGQDAARLFGDVATGLRQDSLEVDLALPKFESRYEDSLLNELSQLGMDIAFQPDQADFSQMIDSHEKILYIGEVKHKSFVRVDEKGTEAAAATSVEMRVTSIPFSENQIVFDRPFVYGILDKETGLPLFAGILEKPEPVS
ncbi:MAG: serine proteinase inhibitor [Clostridia bacterium]|nr:serine proteinase inhibitor [Clostridia bacterium]NCC74978.1 serine proteinase inhibitor [Clostridia bacterium]